jgi:predicted ATP-grasp superfamily ATP-dependent carboligase
MTMQGRALVTDGRSLAALAIVRSLGSAGIDVHVGEEFRGSLASFSRHATRSHRYPSAEERPRAFVQRLRSLIAAEGFDVVIPTRDATTLRIAERREELGREIDLCVADPKTIDRLGDKGRCMKLAADHGVPIPRTYYPNESGLERVRDEATFPVLVKPRRASGSRGIVRVERPADLERRYRSVARDHPDPIVQEYVDHAGGHYSVGTLFDRRSEPVATHVYRETKQYPSSGGPAVNAVSVEREPWVEELLELLGRVGWQGPAHMDVLYDPDDDVHRLLEVNPRFWTSLTLSVRSGVDVPRLLYELAGSDTVPSVGAYDVGLEYRWVVPNELLWAFERDEPLSELRKLLGRGRERTCYGTLSRHDVPALVGVAVQSLVFLSNAERRNEVLGRGRDSKP